MGRGPRSEWKGHFNKERVVTYTWTWNPTGTARCWRFDSKKSDGNIGEDTVQGPHLQWDGHICGGLQYLTPMLDEHLFERKIQNLDL